MGATTIKGKEAFWVELQKGKFYIIHVKEATAEELDAVAAVMGERGIHGIVTNQLVTLSELTKEQLQEALSKAAVEGQR